MLRYCVASAAVVSSLMTSFSACKNFKIIDEHWQPLLLLLCKSCFTCQLFFKLLDTKNQAKLMKLVSWNFQNNVGILALLDEECMLPGNVTDKTFLEKLNVACKNHPHFESRGLKKNQSDRTLPHDAFRLKHYAGSVCYWNLLRTLSLL